MSHQPQTPYTDDPATRAAELRDLAGPVHGQSAATGEPQRGTGASASDQGRETTASESKADRPVIDDSPDARTNPDIDEIRTDSGDDVAGDLEDQYQLRSMGAQPNPTEGDPGSSLNF